jgi:hypothetical protein
MMLDGGRYETLALARGQVPIRSLVLPDMMFVVDSMFMPPVLLAQLQQS